jgi:hypothetical protein
MAACPGPDADGCELEVMINEDDFRRWLNVQPMPAADNRRDAIIRKLLEAGRRPGENINWKAFCRKVCAEAGCECSERTIRRAVNRMRQVDRPVS